MSNLKKPPSLEEQLSSQGLLSSGGGKLLKIDQGGTERAQSFRNHVVELRQNLFKYLSWPFDLQDESELEYYLYAFGVVAVIEINFQKTSKLIFVPVTLSGRKLINKINYENVKITVTGEYNQNIPDAFDLNEKEYKQNIPFIFDNRLQISPEENQSQLFINLAASYNANTSNRINKNKQQVVEVTPGQEVQQAVILSYTMNDYSPFLIVGRENNKGKEKGSTPLKSDDVKPLTNAAIDLYNSNYQEALNIKNEIFTWNGIASTQESNKSSAQETDTQTMSSDRETAHKLKNMEISRKDSIKRISKIFNKPNFGVELTERYKKFIEKTLAEKQDDQEKKESKKEPKEEIKQEEISEVKTSPQNPKGK